MLRILAALVLALGQSLPVQAQSYPSKVVRLVVPFAPGGSSEIIARTLAHRLSENLGQQFIVENKPGGGGNIAMQEVARAEPDGYTLMLGHVGSLAMNPPMFANNPAMKKPPYDANKDFIPVSLVAVVPSLFVVNAGVPAKDLKEFVALARAKPGTINYGSAGNGSAAMRCGVPTASARSLPLFTCGSKGGAPAEVACVWPAIRSVSMGPVPL